ncbi:hypothetical protein PLEOSDRAFT_1109676 [Pleurotus ostreatus PC15]|uniref:Uncharacterized protein n=1 Tax=Pleurotus ostreatus (strain PC15) TaxID=1137138 RepID=A0A067NEM8_PLEO1|nr:hypothetical protein PLEOSDRAFT_1109676 [Pleurotus ostreatus PC15]
MSRTYFPGSQLRYNYYFAHGEHPLKYSVLLEELLGWRWPSPDSPPSSTSKAPDMLAPHECAEARPSHSAVPHSRAVAPRNSPPKSPGRACPNEDPKPNAANGDSHTPLSASTSTSSNAAAPPVHRHDSSPAQNPKALTDLEVSKGKENVAQDVSLDKHVEGVSGSHKDVNEPPPSRKRRVILILPKIIDASAPRRAGDAFALPPRKRKRGPAAAADGKGKTKRIRRKYTEREDDDGVKYKQCNLCEEAIYKSHKKHAALCGKGKGLRNGAPSHADAATDKLESHDCGNALTRPEATAVAPNSPPAVVLANEE